MTKIILTLALLTTMNLVANPFNLLEREHQQTSQLVSQKFIYAKRAAEQGNARAQFDLGLMYAKGEEGAVKESQLAFKWFHKAARNGHIQAKFYIGMSFANGIGVRQQTELARYWFKLAAKAGHARAMAYLASIERSTSPSYGFK
ncbi:MAG TPA: sel1 repeat family protein [Campylobacterales bacterium]|nr:sel1 repeat family protein [Campylobacterales bacterium]HHS92972.1 sel1 repeat family protein [Campylobacterales bacterium]